MSDALCPVCNWAIKQPVPIVINGKTIHVCCEDCAQTLRAQATAN